MISPCEAEEAIMIQYVPYGPQGNVGPGPVGVQGSQGFQGYVGIQGYAGTQGVWNQTYMPQYGNTVSHNTADLAVKASALDALMNDSGDIPPAVRQWLMNKKSGKKGPQGAVEMKPSIPGDRKLDLEEN